MQQKTNQSLVKKPWTLLIWFLLLGMAGCAVGSVRDYPRTTDGTPRPVVGAIRWDAWYGAKDGVGRAVEKSLGPQRWHNRLPFFAQPVSDNEVRFPGYSQEILDREIAYAHQGGLDYWAFLLYPSGSPMTEALSFYLTSAHKADMRFCLILSEQVLGQLRWEFAAPETRAKEINRIVDIIRQPTYQKILDKRPLLYIGPSTQDRWINASGGASGTRKLLDKLREVLRQQGEGDPYIVAMLSNPEPHGTMLTQMGGVDALTAYAVQCNDQHAPFTKLAQCAANGWERNRIAGGKIVPLVMTGWDRRPRIERPVPWETSQKPRIGMEYFYHPPAPTELVEHLKQALLWVDDHPQSAEARAVLIYAWNENDEGGWLVPTLAEGNGKLQALSHLLKKVVLN